jgi:hypothetical protein
MRRAIGLALILLFGPLPVISLWASQAEPECQMACCKRKGMSCSLHRHQDGSSSWKDGNHCPSGCSQVAGAPAFNAAGFPPPHSLFYPVQSDVEFFSPARPLAIPSVVDSFLYQRPPPLV